MLQKFKDFLHLGPLQFRKLLKFFFAVSGQIPLPECSLPHALLLWLIADLNQPHSSSPVVLGGSLSVWPGRLLPWIRHAQGLSSGLERYKICSVPLPTRKPTSKQDLETTQLSITESAEPQLRIPQNISKGIPPRLLEKKQLGDFMTIYIQVDLALENVIWFMLLRKVRFQDNFISVFIIL